MKLINLWSDHDWAYFNNLLINNMDMDIPTFDEVMKYLSETDINDDPENDNFTETVLGDLVIRYMTDIGFELELC